jgi:hypothetical protein
MMARDIEPLDSIIWFERIELVASGALGLENSLRHAAHLLQLAPAPFRGVMRWATDEENFEALLEAGEFGSAARHLLAQPTSLTLENGNETGQVRATIRCAALHRVIEGFGPTEAAAILSVWTSCALALRAEFGADLSRLSGGDDASQLAAVRQNLQRTFGRAEG